MSNRIQLRRTSTPGNIPLLANLLAGEMAYNLADDDLYISNGNAVIHLNSAAAIKTDAGNRFISDTQLAQLTNIASSSVLGHVRIGTNIKIDAAGIIDLDIASTTLTGLLSNVDWNTFNGKQDALGFTPVDKAGDTMLGALTLAGMPTLANHAATKSYVDQEGANYLQKAGGTMTGSLVLAADPTQSLEATTKQYVDGAVANISGSYSAPVQTLLNLAALSSAALIDKQMRLVEDTGAIFRYDVQSIVAADGIDVIVPNDNPATGRWIKIQGATQSHEMLTGLLGGAANDHLHLTTAEKNGYDGHLADVVKHLTVAQNTWLNDINATALEVNSLIGITGNIQTQLDAKQASIGYTPVNRAGDTMTGLLTLSGDPVAAMHAATRNFVETFTVDGGTF